MSVQLYIKDNVDGSVHEYGSNPHDSLILREDGSIVYLNLQNSDGSDHGSYQFCKEYGSDPRDISKWGELPFLDVGGAKTPLDGYLGGHIAAVGGELMIMNKQGNKALFITLEDGRIDKIREEDVKVQKQKGKIIQFRQYKGDEKI